MRQRGASNWSGNDALGFVRVGSEWVPFQSPIGDALGQPINLAAIPGDLDATITWTNNLAAGVNADNVRVQYRLPETTPVWTEENYPITAANFGFLNASTTYQFQVRYITRDPSDGQIDATGPISELFFTTTALTGPGTPAADPGGTGADSIITWPSTGGTPGAVGSSNCWWEYVVQVFDPDTYETTDSSVTDEIAGDIGELEINFLDEGFACGATLRLKYREVCDSVPQDWQYGTYFTVVCDYADPCGAIAQTTAFASAPYLDAVLAMPKICYEDNKTLIEDYIAADVEYGRLPGLVAPLYRSGAWELVSRASNSDIGSPVVAGRVAGLVPLGSSVPSLQSDMSINVFVYVDEAPSVGPFPSTRVLIIGETITMRLYAEGAGVTASVVVPKNGGGTFSLNSTTELAVGEWHVITVTIDQDGDKLLYINGQLDVTDADTEYANFSGLTGSVEVYGNPNMRHKNIAVWDRVLSALEIDSFVFALDKLNPEIWLSAYEPSTITTSGLDVTNWDDLSTNGRHVAVNGTDYPTLGSDAIVFDGTAELRWPYSGLDAEAADLILGGDTTVHLAMMLKLDATAAADGVVIGAPNTSSGGSLRLYITPSGAVRYRRRPAIDSDGGDFTSTATPFADNDWHLFEIVSYRTATRTWQIHVDGVQILVGNMVGFASAVDFRELDIGHWNGAEHFKGEIAEIVSYAAINTNENQRQIRDTVASGKGVTVSEFNSGAVPGGPGTTLTGLTGLGLWLNFSDSDKVVRANTGLLSHTGMNVPDETATYDPSLLVAGPNGLDALRRSPTTQATNYTLSSTLTNSTGAHVVALVKWDGTAGSVLNLYDTVDPGDDLWLDVDVNGKLTYRFTTGAGGAKSTFVESGTSFVDEDWHVVELILAETALTIELKVDGTSLGTNTYTGFASACDFRAFTFNRCDISEVAVFPANAGGATARSRIMTRAGL
jgi:hypothetical protein